MKAFPIPLWKDKGTYKELIDSEPVRVERLEVDDSTTYIDKDGSDNMTLTDAVTGTKTLAQLADTINKSDLDKRSFVNLVTNGDMENGDPPTGWTAYNSTPAQEGTTVKTGSYSIKITCNGNWADVYQTIGNYAYYKGRKVTFGAWALADSGNDKNQALAIIDGAGSSSTAIDKDDTWHWVTVTRTIAANASKLELSLTVNNSAVPDTDDILYGDGAILVEGDSCPAFSEKPPDEYHATSHTNGTDDIQNATTAQKGIVELAIASEINTGTDATRANSPDALAGSNFGIRYFQAVVFDFTTDVATGDGKLYFHVPPALNGMNLIYCHAEVITAGSTNTLDIQIYNLTQTADMLSTKLTVDSGETGSDTAATPYVIDGNEDDVATNDVLRADVDAVHTTPPKGLILTLGFQLP